MPSSFAFKTEESVLAYHGPLIHEASVLDCVAKDTPDGKSKLRLYLLHYSGWNSHWDEWVPESRLLKHTAEGLALQKDRIKEFQRAHKRKAKDGGAAAAKKPKGAAAGAAASEESLSAEQLREPLRLPHGMKLKLIEDWERITREKKLVPLPRTPSINALLADFLQAKARKSSHERLYGEVCDGVRSYFNQALGSILLYKYERRQYREIKESHKGQPPVDVYGAEHLLRLFVKLPELLVQCKMQREHMTVLVAKLMELLKFLQANKAKYFAAQYDTPDDEYIRWWSSE